MVALDHAGICAYRLDAHFNEWILVILPRPNDRKVIAGFAGNVASFAFSPNTLAAGASTAIFGLLGACLMLGDTYRENPVIRQLARQFLLLVVLNLAFNLFSSGVDIYGHIGGLLGGFLAAGMLGAPALGRMSTGRRLASTITLIFGLVALLLFGIQRGIV